jgi:hypothetical protein
MLTNLIAALLKEKAEKQNTNFLKIPRYPISPS